MALPLPGSPISLQNIELEFGGSHPISISEYYGKGGRPEDGTISLGDFLQNESYRPDPVSSNLILELDATDSNSWPGSGTAWDDVSGNNISMALINGVTGGSDSVVFDGVDNYAQTPNDSTWIPDSTDPCTFEFFANIHSLSIGQFNAPDRCFLSKTSPGNQQFTMGLIPNGSGIDMFMKSNSGGNIAEYVTISTDGVGVLNEYNHYCYTFDGSIVRMYFNGSLVYTSSNNKRMGNNTAPLRLMCLDPSNSQVGWHIYVDGELRFVRMYDRPLSDSEVILNRNSCTGGIEPVSDTTITVNPIAHSGGVFNVTFEFDQMAFGFTDSDITVTGGTKGSLIESVDYSRYVMAITPTPSTGDVDISIPANATSNSANLGNNAINSTIPYSTFNYSNLVCYLDANDPTSYSGSGSIWTDVSGSNNNGTIYNAAFSDSGYANYFNFNGIDTYVEVTRMVGDGSFSLAAWINTTNHGGTGVENNDPSYTGYGIIDTDTNGSADFGLSVRDGSAGFGVSDNSAIWSDPSNHPVTDGEWHYIAATRNASTGEIILYVDGVQAAQNPTDGETYPLDDTATIRIGRIWSSNSRYYNGEIGEIHIYDEVLTPSEVTANYNSRLGQYYNPTPTVSISPVAHTNQQFTITFDWNWDINNFTSSDITVTNASKGSFSGSGKTYTLVVTPSGTSTINVSIPANAVTRDGGTEKNDAFSQDISYSTFPTDNIVNLLRRDGYPGSGTTWNATYGSMTGTLNNANLWNSNGYFYFDGGVENRISITNGGDVNSTFTMVMWFLPEGSNTRTLVSSTEGSGTLQVRLANNKLQLVRSYEADMGYLGNNTLANGTIYCLILTRSGSTYNAYVDGGSYNGSNLFGSVTSSDTFSRNHTTIGVNQGSLERWEGRIYGYGWWSSVLSASQRSQVFDAGVGMGGS